MGVNFNDFEEEYVIFFCFFIIWLINIDILIVSDEEILKYLFVFELRRRSVSKFLSDELVCYNFFLDVLVIKWEIL